MPRAGCHQLPGACGAAAAVKEGLHSLIFSFQTTSCWSRGIWQSSADLSLVPGREGKSAAGSPLWNMSTQPGEIPSKSSSRRCQFMILLQEHQEAPAEPEEWSMPRRPQSVSGLQFACAEWSTPHPHGGMAGGHPCGAHFTITEQHWCPFVPSPRLAPPAGVHHHHSQVCTQGQHQG